MPTVVHPLADAPLEARPLVAGEVEAAGRLEVLEQLLQAGRLLGRHSTVGLSHV